MVDFAANGGDIYNMNNTIAEVRSGSKSAKFSLLILFFAILLISLACTQFVNAKEIRGRGDFEIFLDEAVFLRPGGKLVQEIYIRLLNSEIKFQQEDDGWHAKLDFKITIEDKKGHAHIDDSFILDVMETDQEKTVSPINFQTVIKRYELPPGKYYLTCSVKDVLSPKATVVGMIGKRLKTSLVERLVLHVPSFDPAAVTISDALFLWDVERRVGLEVYHPNPLRMYGLHKDSLETYLEVYLPEGMGEGGALHIESVLLNEKGEELAKSVFPLNIDDAPKIGSNQDGESQLRRIPVLFEEDLNVFPAGSYALYANIVLDDRLIGRFRCGMFSVAWDLRTWESSRRTYLAEARFLLGDKDFQDFRNKSLGDQEKMLLELWESLDPTPNSGSNEAYEEFNARLNYVEAHYSDYQQGSFTDRGLIFMKYGPPDEMIAEVIPVNRESVTDALEKIDNRFHPVTFSSHGVRGAYDMPTKDVIIDPRRIGAVGEGGNMAYPFELWVYNNSGQPILERDRALETDIGLRFIFIDREGYGRYKLESSSSMTDK
jgi:GWxTD domain-containing protein